jgi:rubrerythrin
MDETPDESFWICTECGYTSSERFAEDICPRCSKTYWMCDECGFTTIAGLPPDFCPECGGQGYFINRTCYIPEMGTPEPPKLKIYYS